MTRGAVATEYFCKLLQKVFCHMVLALLMKPFFGCLSQSGNNFRFGARHPAPAAASHMNWPSHPACSTYSSCVHGSGVSRKNSLSVPEPCLSPALSLQLSVERVCGSDVFLLWALIRNGGPRWVHGRSSYVQGNLRANGRRKRLQRVLHHIMRGDMQLGGVEYVAHGSALRPFCNAI